MHYSVAKIKQIEAIEFAGMDTVDPKTPQTALARFIKNISNIQSASARADLYKQVIDAPGLNDTEKAWVKIIQIFDTPGNTSEDRTQLMKDISEVVVSNSAEGDPITMDDVLTHAAESSKKYEIFKSISAIINHPNIQKVAPYGAIAVPPTAPYLMAYGARNVPGGLYGYFTAKTDDERAEHLRTVIGGLGDGLKNSGPIVKPLALFSAKLGWMLKPLELLIKAGLKEAALTFSDKKKTGEFWKFFESIGNDPKGALPMFDSLRVYFGEKSDVLVGYAITAVHAKFGNPGTFILKELSDRGFFKKLLEGNTKEAEAIKAELDPTGEVTAELERIRREEETPAKLAERQAIANAAIAQACTAKLQSASLMDRLSLVTAFGPSTENTTPPVFSGHVGLAAANDALRNER